MIPISLLLTINLSSLPDEAPNLLSTLYASAKKPY